jgi:hypothetical protein
MQKFGNVSFRVAVLSTVLLIGSIFFTVEKVVSNAAVADWQQGASIQSKNPQDFASESFKQSIRDLKATGANSVSLIIPYFQSSSSASDIYPANHGPSDETLIAGINYIHSQGMDVMLKPHLESGTDSWRAMISANDRAAWYRNYSAMLNHLGDIGKQTGVESIAIGTELISMATNTSNADNTEQWVNMINSLRSHYSGKLTYSANWGNPGSFTDEAHHIGFWPQLDYIGISAYYNLNASSNSYASLKAAWDIYRTRDIEPLYNQYHKPILFTEVGYRSVAGAHNEPWNYALGGGADLQEQANDYEALFKYWDSYSYMVGVQLWNWDSNPNAGGTHDTGYTPQNKTAEGVMTRWFGGSSNPNPDPTPTTTPPVTPPTQAVWNTSAQSQNVHVGTAVTIPVTLSTNVPMSGANVDIEIYSANGQMVSQKIFENQTFTAHAIKHYSVTWTPSQQGTYTAKVGAFTGDWKTNYFWNNDLATISVTMVSNPGNPNPPTNPPTNPGTTTPPTNPNPPSEKPIPTVVTLSPQVNARTATLMGTVNMNGGRGTVWFEYSTDGKTWPGKAGAKGIDGNTTYQIAVPLGNLQKGKTYYYKIMAENYTGGFTKSLGGVKSFTIR